MIIIPKHIRSVTLFCRNGSSRTYKSKKIALKALGIQWIYKNVGLHFNVAEISFNGFVTIVHFDYILRDDVGNALSAVDFYGLDANKTRINRKPSSNAIAVPGTAKRKASAGACYRRISHMNARRAAETFQEEGEVSVRPARNTRNLPNNWDDYVSSAWDHHCWKQYRKTQYREARNTKKSGS